MLNKEKKYNEHLRQLEQAEVFWLKQINEAGYRTPFDLEDDGSKAHDYIYMVRAGGKYRRFVTGFKYVNYNQLRHGTKQVRELVVNEAYVKNELHSKIERIGLQHPSIVTETELEEQFEIGSGHHRAKHEQIFSGKIPVIIASELYNVETGKVAHPHEDLRSRVQTNKAQTQHPITQKGGVIAIAEAFHADPYFEGANPSGKLPPRTTTDDSFDWDDLCESIFGESGNFTDKGSRTKLRNQYTRHQSASKVVSMTEDAKNDFLDRNKRTRGLNDKGKRAAPHFHFDEKNECLILLTDNNGRHFNEKFETLMRKSICDEDYNKILVENNIKYVDVFAYLYNPALTKTDNDKAYTSFEKMVKECAYVMNTHPLCPLEVRKCVRAKMLVTDPNDCDKTVNIL